MIEITSTAEFEEINKQYEAVLYYFSHNKCSVCKTLKPKIEQSYGKQFPKLKQFYVNTEKAPELSAQLRIFTVPVILVYFDGKETIKKARNVGINELASQIDRYYQMIF